jgi:hypothetical protein
MKTLLRSERDELFSTRLVYMAEGEPEGMAPDEAGEGGGGVSEQAAEQAAEDRKNSRKANKKQKKEERKVKGREDKLADIIRGFINGAQRDDKIALLISRLFQRNCPAPVLLSVMSLNYPDVLEALENYLEEEMDVMPDKKPIQDGSQEADKNQQALVEYGKEMAESLSEWTRRIFTHASFRPMKSIVALAHHHGVDHNMIQLTSFMVKRYFDENGQEMEMERTKEFSNAYWRDALKRLHLLADKRGLLPDPTQDPMDDEEDDDEDEDE